jgi:exodeoxyribonuclease VII large subunit
MQNTTEVLSVSDITNLIKLTLEENFEQVSILGEISNFKNHVSGHWYFTLKDGGAQISCTMWKGLNNYVFFTPQDGMKIIVTGRITVYPPRGNYQFDVRSMKPAGEGELQAAFERLKRKLDEEGLFDEQYKKEIPSLPKKIGIATAIAGAALKDMISVAKRRFPMLELVIAPCQVQGEGAAKEIANSIKELNKHDDIDVIIVGRGGGSMEDLWSFNEEIVARAIFASKIPIISAVGHEIDFTISDFVADLRAPTPSAAMEIATPDINDYVAVINNFLDSATDSIEYIIDNSRQRVFNAIGSYGFKNSKNLIDIRKQYLDNIIYKMLNGMDKKISGTKQKISLLASSIENHNVNRTLRRGFALVKQDGKFVHNAKNYDYNKETSIKFYDNEILIEKK